MAEIEVLVTTRGNHFIKFIYIYIDYELSIYIFIWNIQKLYIEQIKHTQNKTGTKKNRRNWN